LEARPPGLEIELAPGVLQHARMPPTPVFARARKWDIFIPKKP
jgi:hypothetical protein